jgi:DNA-binding response OmpR family regulator
VSGKPRVLIVDDEPDVLLTLRMILEAEGFDPALAADGETALRRIDEESPDLVVLDIMMPVLDGWWCARRSRATRTATGPRSSRRTSTSRSRSSPTIWSR